MVDEIVAEIWPSVARYEQAKGEPCRYFRRSAKNRVISRRRRFDKWSRLVSVGDEFLGAVPERTVEDDRPSLSDADEGIMAEVLAKTSPRNRKIFWLYREGWSRKDIAAEAGTTTENIGVVVFRLLKEMRPKMLGSHG